MRVLTWNTWWHFSDWEARRPLLAATVKAARPDIVLLQETWPEQAEALAAACDLAVVGYSGRPFDPAPTGLPDDVPFGNAILAAPGSTSAPEELLLPAGGGRATRYALAAKTSAFGPEVLVATTHLASSADDGAAREQQMAAIVDWADRLHPDGPILLGGDLNQTPSSWEYQAGITPHWVDLWATVQPDDPGLTMIGSNPNVRHGEWMARRNEPDGPTEGVRFDYLLTRDGGEPNTSGLSVEAMTVVGGADDGWPSDHLGLVADFVAE